MRPRTSKRTVSVACSAILAFAALSAAGCKPEMGATVTGRVTFDGQPAPAGVIVSFQPQVPNSSASTGVTGPDGRYDLRFNARLRGAMPGESVVSLAIAEDVDTGSPEGRPEPKRRPVIPPQYGAKSTVRKDVKPGPNVIDIDIETTRKP